MHLIVGLGNPGKEYEKTRHNIGFLSMDVILDQLQLPLLKHKKDFEGTYCKTTIAGNAVILLKPHTYMNLSGKCIQKVIRFYDIPTENVIVIHDDISLSLGKTRIVKDSSSGGQKGVQSIINLLGKDFVRIKIGIGREESRDASSFVLSAFTKAEWKTIQETLLQIPIVLETILTKGLEKAQNQFN